MKKKRIVISLLLVFIIIIIIVILVQNNNKPLEEMSLEEQKEISNAIVDFNVDSLDKYVEEDMQIVAPIGDDSQIDAPISDSEELVEYKKIYETEQDNYHKYYEEKTNINVGEVLYNEDQKRFEQKLSINSYSLMGYNIVFNDLLLFYMEALGNKYLEQGVEPGSMELTLDVYTPMKTLAIVYANDYFLTKDDTYNREVVLIWEQDRNGEWKCDNLNTELNNLIDPEGIGQLAETNEENGTALFDKYHAISVEIWESIINDPDWDIFNPIKMLLKKQ